LGNAKSDGERIRKKRNRGAAIDNCEPIKHCKYVNISTLAKTLGVSINDLRSEGEKLGMRSFSGRNTRIPYNDALGVTKVLRPDRAASLADDNKIYLPFSLTVGELADAIGRPPGLVVKTLVMNGVLATLNEKIDYDTASLVASEMNVEVHPESEELNQSGASTSLSAEKIFASTTEGTIVERPPVVTVMGHVDHGKTSLLDTIRKSNVVATEAGAITQHISSYQVEVTGKKITFVDTPGHEAFTAMRARGTQLADFIILVVSAVEGPKPQTVEVIERAKISGTPIIVAINKIDLPEADPEKIKGDLAAFNLVPEEWGGSTPMIGISAKTGANIDKLLETILLHAEVADLKTVINVPAEAVVLESHLDKSQGPVATVIITKDSLKVGDIFAIDTNVGKVRKISDSNGKNLDTATITEPVEISGLSEVAKTGDILKIFATQKEAQNYIATQKIKQSKKIFSSSRSSGDDDIKLVLKADVAGSLEALKEGILKIPSSNAQVNILDESVGAVTDSDTDFAETSGATILAFHTDVPNKIAERIKNNSVGLVASDIIYELLEWIEEQILMRTKHEIRIDVLGTAEVLATFSSDKPKIQVWGGEVKQGKLFDNKPLRVMREGEEIGRLEVVEFQKNKVRAKEINISQQFGASVTGKVKVEKGDIIECIDEIVVK
jgi:translation initiation factor IF-2